MDRERKQYATKSKKDEQPVDSRIVHRKVHPDDYAKIGMDSKSNPRDYGNTFAEEMSIIQEIADR